MITVSVSRPIGHTIEHVGKRTRPTVPGYVFDAMARLTSMRDSKARAAARLVLVNGQTQRSAAAALGVTQQTVSAACMRLWLVRADAIRAAR